MNLGQLFNTLGAAMYDGIDEDTPIQFDARFQDFDTEIQSIWVKDGGFKKSIVISAHRAPQRGQTVLWEKRLILTENQ
jgi:hypothetical protein